MPVTILDLSVIGIVLISALLAMLRGFTREVLAIASWALAALAAYAFYPMALPYASQVMPGNKTVAIAIAAGGIFLATLIVAYFLTAKLSDIILDSRIGALDRTLGFLFGAVRGFLLVVIAFVFMDWLIKKDQRPTWMREAKTLNLLESSGAYVKTLLPDDEVMQNLKFPKVDGEGPKEPVPAPPATDKKTDAAPANRARAAEGTVPARPLERNELNRLIDTNAQTRPKPLPQ
jgi:membrane protein required for colicin V production